MIEPHLTPFRNPKEHNQYIYPLYERFTKNYVFSEPDFAYRNLGDDPKSLCRIIQNQEQQILCINGKRESEVPEESIERLKSAFKSILVE